MYNLCFECVSAYTIKEFLYGEYGHFHNISRLLKVHSRFRKQKHLVIIKAQKIRKQSEM